MLLAVAGLGAGCGDSDETAQGPPPAAKKAPKRPQLSLEERFVAYAAGGDPVQKRRRFVVGNFVALRFKDKVARATRYRVCVTDPARNRSCQRGRTGRRGAFDELRSSVDTPGRYIATWYVAGDRVETWKYRVEAEQEEPAAAPPPPQSAPSGRLRRDPAFEDDGGAYDPSPPPAGSYDSFSEFCRDQPEETECGGAGDPRE